VRAQEGIARNQTQLFRQTSPYYNQVLQLLSQNAGIEIPGVTTPASGVNRFGPWTGPRNPYEAGRPLSATGNPSVGSSPLPAGSGALPGSLLGIYNQNEQDRLALGAAEDDIGRIREARNQQLRFQLGRRGAGEATISSALAQNEGDYQSQIAAFRRNLALAARGEQERRLMQLIGALAPGLGQGSAAAGIYGGQAGLYGGQAAAAGQGVGSFLSNWMLAEAMRRRGTGGIAGPLDPLNSYSPYGAIDGSWWR